MNLDFPTILVLLVALTGGIWGFDVLYLAPRRRQLVAGRGPSAGAADEVGVSGSAVDPPQIVEYARSFFPVFLIVLLLRSFLAEPFRIPSPSMMPTLVEGDFILVSKFSYGIRLPILESKILDLGIPERGDVVVFRYPNDPTTPYIKRVVGLPGDRIQYGNKTLVINGEPVPQDDIGFYRGTRSGKNMTGLRHRRELLEDAPHDILIRAPKRGLMGPEPNEFLRTCPDTGCVVPQNSYFVMGDNRDHSSDSRVWGYVPDEFLIGKAFVIWFNWDFKHSPDIYRIGTIIE